MKLPNEILIINQADVKVFKKPYCDIVELPFTMGTFDHLDVDIFSYFAKLL